MGSRAACVLALAVLSLGSGEQPTIRGRFHHLHVNEQRAGVLLAFYDRLFSPNTIRRVRVDSAEGITSDDVYILIDEAAEEPLDDGPVWHFGWGDVSVDLPYDRHRLSGEWSGPLDGLVTGLHLHLNSPDPLRTAAWYRDAFGGVIETPQHGPPRQAMQLLHRRPAALVRLDGIAMLIYYSPVVTPSSKQQHVDRIGFAVTDLDIAVQRFRPVARGTFGGASAVTIEGPDGLTIALVQQER